MGITFLFSITKTHLLKYIEHVTPKKGKFSEKKIWHFSYFCSNIDCGYSLEPPRRGGSNEYPQSMFFLAEIRKIIYTPVNPSFTISKWDLRGSKLYRHVFVMIISSQKTCVVPLGGDSNVETQHRFLWRNETYKQANEKAYKMAWAPCADSDQPGRPPSLIRVFAVRSIGS